MSEEVAMREEAAHDKAFYIVGWILVVCIGVYIAIKKVCGVDVLAFLPPCQLYSMWSIYCPGCGITRAFYALMRGDIVAAAWHHPFLVYVVVLGIYFMITQTIERITQGKIKIAMHFRMIYLWIGFGLLIANCIIKNLLLVI